MTRYGKIYISKESFMEIERKYLVNTYPYDLKAHEYYEITQGYISTDPVVRIRQAGDAYYLTCKSKGLLAREEFEQPISEASFHHLSGKIDHHIIYKTRYLIPYDHGKVIELDVFKNQLNGLMMAEVEFDSLEEANEFISPSWFLEEVTEDAKYHNSNLCQIDQYEK